MIVTSWLHPVSNMAIERGKSHRGDDMAAALKVVAG
jgi:hypothetical protein